MQKTGNRSGKYWIDTNGNKWNRIAYSESEAERLSHTLIKCKNCVNSEYLVNCKDCDESAGCIDSYDLKSCIRCTECQSCEKCEDCIGCTGLHKVKHYTNNEKVEY